MKRGIPNRMMNLDNRTRKIDLSLLPESDEAVQLYPGIISPPCNFGVDPLHSDDSKKNIRLEVFCSRYSFELLFSEVSNGSIFHLYMLYYFLLTQPIVCLHPNYAFLFGQ